MSEKNAQPRCIFLDPDASPNRYSIYGLAGKDFCQKHRSEANLTLSTESHDVSMERCQCDLEHSLDFCF
jgi:hypothetical protein